MFGCKHEWQPTQMKTKNPLFGRMIYILRHKCVKCGKVEDCNENATGNVGGTSIPGFRCSKCGQQWEF